jgi:hypothetical protein
MKNTIAFAVYICIQPLLNTLYMVYTIFTIRQQSWGGVRVDRGEEQNKKETVDLDSISVLSV